MKIHVVIISWLLAHVCYACYANGTIFPSTPEPLLISMRIGGVAADISEAPYQVALLKDNWGTTTFIQFCGGSILTPRVVVTSARCTHKTRADQWRVRAGSTYHTTGGQVVSVSHFIVHSEFNECLDNDISLVFPAEELILGKDVLIINLPYQDQIFPDGTNAVVTGWGHLSENGVRPSGLYKMTLPIHNQELCAIAYADHCTAVTDNMICAGEPESGGPGACQVDSGGPLAVNGTLVGLTSWAEGCPQARRPGVWTRVAAYTNWINNYS